jgi:glutaredoxin
VGHKGELMSDTELAICPEGLIIAEAYLSNKSNVKDTAHFLGMEVSLVEKQLNKGEVKRYLDRIYMESGFRNRDKMGDLMDEIIKQKLEEMRDTGLGSSRDIVDIMKIAHEMKMKELEMQMKLEASNVPSLVVNQQNNYGGDNYNKLLEKLVNGS